MSDSNDLEAVERRIEEEYLRARNALHCLRKYLANGAGGASAIPINHAAHDANSESQTVIGKVEEVMFADLQKRWTVPEMIEHLKKTGFKFATKTPNGTVGLVFAKLRKRGKVRIVKKGAGKNPNWFRAVPIEQEETSENVSQSERAAS